MKQMKYEITLKQMQVESDYHREVFKRLNGNTNNSQTVVAVVEPVPPVVDVIEDTVELDLNPRDIITHEIIDCYAFIDPTKTEANLSWQELYNKVQDIFQGELHYELRYTNDNIMKANIKKLTTKLNQNHSHKEDVVEKANKINLQSLKQI